MLGSLAAGISLAIGHHILYSRLAGHEAPSGNYAFGIFTYSRQEANIQFGTALAFLVKAALVLAVATAYIQLFWRNVLQRKADRGTPLSHIDTAFSVMGNIVDLFRVGVWWRCPIALLLALIAW